MTSEQEFNRYSIAASDFEKATSYAEEALRHSVGDLAHEALVFAAIVTFYRPFSPNEVDPRAPAVKGMRLDQFAPLSVEDQAIYDRCKELRSQALAHSAWKYHPTRRSPDTGTIVSRPFELLAYAPDMSALADVARRLHHKCDMKRMQYVHDNPRRA